MLRNFLFLCAIAMFMLCGALLSARGPGSDAMLALQAAPSSDAMALQADVSAVRAEVSAIRAEVSAIKMQANVSAVRAEVSALRAEVSAIKEGRARSGEASDAKALAQGDASAAVAPAAPVDMPIEGAPPAIAAKVSARGCTDQGHLRGVPPTDMAPLMSSRDQALFRRKLSQAKNYFEFGSGGSTAWAVNTLNIQKIRTVENDLVWVGTLRDRKDVQCATQEGRHQFFPIDLGPVGAFAYPMQTDAISRARWGSYSDQIFTDTVTVWDLILVDGRFRVACALKALQQIKDPSSTLIVIHDYQRQSYHKVERFTDVVEQADILVILRKKANVDEVKLAAAVALTEEDLE